MMEFINLLHPSFSFFFLFYQRNVYLKHTYTTLDIGALVKKIDVELTREFKGLSVNIVSYNTITLN